MLIVEDEPQVALSIQRALETQAIDAAIAADGHSALELAARTAFELLILDIRLPDVDGFTVCRRLRGSGATMPILMLSARSMVSDRVRGLDAGADDYLIKPFALDELHARVRALMRRPNDGAQVLRAGDLVLDRMARTVRRGTRRIELTQKEFAVLEHLMRVPGQVQTRAMIAERVWNFPWDGLTNAVDVYISHLRRKLEQPGEPRLLHSVRGVGYMLGGEQP